MQRAEEQEGGVHLQHGDVVLRDADGKEMSAGGKELRKKLREINAVDHYDEEDDFEFDESDIEDAANEGAPDEVAGMSCDSTVKGAVRRVVGRFADEL